MSVNIEEIAAAAYFYRGGGDMKTAMSRWRSPRWCAQDHGEIGDGHDGRAIAPQPAELVAQLQARGCYMHIKRARGHRVPLGRMVQSDQTFDYYVVDL